MYSTMKASVPGKDTVSVCWKPLLFNVGEVFALITTVETKIRVAED